MYVEEEEEGYLVLGHYDDDKLPISSILWKSGERFL